MQAKTIWDYNTKRETGSGRPAVAKNQDSGCRMPSATGVIAPTVKDTKKTVRPRSARGVSADELKSYAGSSTWRTAPPPADSSP
jgi:hypothetical protein